MTATTLGELDSKGKPSTTITRDEVFGGNRLSLPLCHTTCCYSSARRPPRPVFVRNVRSIIRARLGTARNKLRARKAVLIAVCETYEDGSHRYACQLVEACSLLYNRMVSCANEGYDQIHIETQLRKGGRLVYCTIHLTSQLGKCSI